MISIIIPVYNRSNTIERTIANIFEQTYSDIELIVVDDGSTDNIDQVMKKNRDPRLKYIKSDKNYGACHARNIGIKVSKGEYIAFQDSDDLWASEKLEHQLQYLMDTGKEICICRMRMVYENGSSIEFHPVKMTSADISLENELAKNFISTQLLLGHRHCFEKEMFDELFPRFQDWDIGIRLVKEFSFCFLDEILVDRLMQKNSISANPQKGLQGGTRILEKYKADFDRLPKVKAKYLLTYAKLQEDCGQSSTVTIKESLKLDFSCQGIRLYAMQKTGILQTHLKKRRGISK